MKSAICALMSMVIFTFSIAQAGEYGPSCNNQTAFKKMALSALKEAGYTEMKLSDLQQTKIDNHDPEFVVNIAGESVTVSCDDSGDDDCQCGLDN